MSKVQTVNHKDRKIVIMDLSNITSANDLSLRVEEIIGEIKKSVKPKSVYALLDLTNMKINKSTLPYMKRLSLNNGPFMKYVAFVGLNPVYSFIFKTMFKLTKRINHNVIKNRKDALDWLGSC